MSRHSKNHTRLAVEELEGRRLLSAHLASTFPAPVASAPAGQPARPGARMSVDYGGALAAGSQGSSQQAMIWTYAVVSLRNPTNRALNVQFRWSADSAWTSYAVPPRGYVYFYFTSYEKPAPQVRFDTDPSTGSGPVVESLRYSTVRTGGTPSYNDAYHYAFALRRHTLTLSPSAT
jgi:hypothetical protein